MNRTGAINSEIAAAMARMTGHEKWMISILMALFAAGGTTYGLAEETLAFYGILIPVIIAAGYDVVTGVAIILIRAGIGGLGSTINPFATTIASNAAGLCFTDGLILRLALLGVGWIICGAFVMRYAAKVKADPTLSIVADRRADNARHFGGIQAGTTPGVATTKVTTRQSVVLILFAATFGLMILGGATQGWWMAEMSRLFLGAALVIGTVGWIGEKPFVESFVDGAHDLLGVALIIGLARRIVVVMDAGHITDTILNASEQATAGTSKVVFINAMYWIEIALSFPVPSTSGLAVLSMPILAPVSDFAGVDRSLTVTAYQWTAGLVNLITPTSAVVVGGLAIGRLPCDRWLRFIAPLLGILTVLIMAALRSGGFAMTAFGVHSETGKLRRVITCAPGLAHDRLTPANCDSLLFDDVFVVQQAHSDHRDFFDKMVARGVVLIGLGECSTPQAVGQVARALFAAGAATRVIGCAMPPSRAAMHLDTEFTLCDRDIPTSFVSVAETITCYNIRPGETAGLLDIRRESEGLFDVVAQAMGLKDLRVIPKGGDSYEQAREQ